MARRSRAHRLEITLALIAGAVAIITALIANLDKIVPRDPPPQPQAESRTQAPAPAGQPAGGVPTEAVERLSNSQERALTDYANALDDISRKVEAASANSQ